MNPDRKIAQRAEVLEGKEQPKIFGVWLILLNPENQIFMLKNLQLKRVSHKVPGQIGVPAETYKTQDDRKFNETIKRAITEEIGSLDYDASEQKMIGIVNFKSNGYDIIAPVYLIQVSNADNIHFNPNDENPSHPENCCPEWTKLEDVTYDKKLSIGRFEVPLYRFPMVEIVEMIKEYQSTHLLQVRRLQTPIPEEVFVYLEQNPSPDNTA